MPPPPRTTGGHRLYGDAHAKRLHFIRQGRALGFPLDQLRILLDLTDDGEQCCGEVEALTSEHLFRVQRKISELRQLEHALTDLIARCRDNGGPGCPIIGALTAAKG